MRASAGAFDFVLEIVSPLFGATARSIALGCMLALGGCGPSERVEIEGVVRDGRTGEPIAGATISTEDGHHAQTDEEGRFSVDVEEGSGRRLSARADHRCPVDQHLTASAATPAITLNLFPRLEAEAEHAQVGFDAEVRIEVRARCDADAALEWRQIAGPELGPERMRVERGGRVLVVRTHPIEELVVRDGRVGVLALDRHQRGDYRLEVSGELGGQTERATVRVLGAPTSGGLFQVPTGADVYLEGGDGDRHEWELLSRPDESEAALSDPAARNPHFRPDRFGTYLVEHRPSNTQMSLQAGAYEDVPRDCGREGCHEAEASGWTHTAHATTFRRGLSGELGEGFEERCWSCHATGVDPGIENGGLHHTASSIDWTQPAPDASVWDDAPRRIRRHGSVWCSACHGPGRIVPPPYRWQYGAKLQVGVCARCHDVDADDPDASHVSPHVDEWRLAPMSRFARALREDDPALREGCASCHSAQGFVSWRRRGEHIAPDRDTVAPITCGACHDAHDASHPSALRVYDTSDPVDGSPIEHLGAGALCASCHRAGVAREGEADAAPHAPQTDLLVGRGARSAARRDVGAHRHIADTCARCHMTRPERDDPRFGRVGGHTFALRAATGDTAIHAAACAPCHGETEPSAIGARDWDGDGREGALGEEHDAALAAVSELLRARIARAAIADSCGHVATDFVEHDARLHLVDARGTMLGDCDSDGDLSGSETALTARALPRPLADAAWDLAMLRADGSRGVHNPAYTFEILGALRRALH